MKNKIADSRCLELDAMRGIAVLMVVIYHYTTWNAQSLGYSHTTPLFVFDVGKLGVELFFMISGFVIFLTLNRQKNAADFLVSRFSRLYPAYWVAVIFTFSVVTIFTLPGREVDLQAALINLTMIQKWLREPNVDGVYWTLAVELSFYFIMLCLFWLKQLKNIVLISYFWLTLMLCAYFYELHSGVVIHEAINLMLLLTYGNLFIAGIMFYKLKEDSSVFIFGATILSFVVESFLRPESIDVLAIFFITFYLFIKGKLTSLSAKPLIFLGTISYSLYLIHQHFGYVLIKLLEDSGFANSISVIVLPLIASILIATLMQRYIEQPALERIRRDWKGSSLRSRVVRNYEK